MKHKDIGSNQDNQIRDIEDKANNLYIIKNKKPYTVLDYLPNYSYDYDHTDINQESNTMIDSLHEFIKNNSELAISQYSCKDQDAIIEGFARAIAIVELYIKTMYIEE